MKPIYIILEEFFDIVVDNNETIIVGFCALIIRVIFQECMKQICDGIHRVISYATTEKLVKTETKGQFLRDQHGLKTVVKRGRKFIWKMRKIEKKKSYGNNCKNSSEVLDVLFEGIPERVFREILVIIFEGI